MKKKRAKQVFAGILKLLDKSGFVIFDSDGEQLTKNHVRIETKKEIEQSKKERATSINRVNLIYGQLIEKQVKANKATKQIMEDWALFQRGGELEHYRNQDTGEWNEPTDI